jgi:hypothetical protein
MERDKMIVMKNWLSQLEGCGIEQQKEICYLMLKYGLQGEYKESKDVAVNVAMNFITPQIDAMQEEYDKQVAKGKTGGRPSTIDNKIIWTMAQEGKTGAKIAEELNVPKTTIYSSQGWKQRNNKNYENFS